MYKIAYSIKSKHPGVTSLLFVLAIGLLLVIMVAGIAALTVREQQQASNTELSNRALQAAEAGVKAAAQKLEADSNYTKADCAPGSDFSTLSLGSGQSISCITVSRVSQGGWSGYVESDKSQEFFAGPDFSEAPNSPGYLKIEWNDPGLGDSSNPVFSIPPAKLYPPSIAGYNNAALIELNVIYWPTRDANPDSFRTETFLIAPVNSSTSDTDANVRRGVKATCSSGNGYNCTTTNAAGQQGFNVKTALNLGLADSVDNYNFDIRIVPRYANTHFKLSAFGTDGAVVAKNLLSNYAQIDVTAKSGNLYRRIKAQKQIKPTIYDSVFTSVLYTGKGTNDDSQRDICKNFAVRLSGTDYVVGTANMAGAKPNCNNLPY